MKYIVKNLCADCGEILNETIEMTKDELSEAWTMIVMSGGLTAGSCKSGCRSTYSDLNMNTEMKIWDITNQTYIEDKKAFFNS